jgi:cytoskeletal protein RodZ
MKRVATLITLLLLTGILLPSCGVTIRKRQHTKGFYVNTNPRIPTAKGTKEEIRPEEQETVAEIPEETTTAPSEQLAEATPEQLAEVTEPTVTTDVPTVVAQDRSVTPTTRTGVFQHTDQKPFLERMAEKNPLKKKLDNQKMKARASSGEALSLFWIVILILLLLWAIGVISGGWGLGGVIYILLIIALILLILWLLRIV